MSDRQRLARGADVGAKRVEIDHARRRPDRGKHARRGGACDQRRSEARTRRGVEAWVEQPTSFNPPSILLVAADGESTRRGLPSAAVGYSFAAEHDMPCYDAGVVPYPKRMREYGQRAKRADRS